MPREFLSNPYHSVTWPVGIAYHRHSSSGSAGSLFHYIIRTCLHQQILSTFFCVNIFYLFFIKFSVFPVDRFSLRPALVQLRLR